MELAWDILFYFILLFTIINIYLLFSTFQSLNNNTLKKEKEFLGILVGNKSVLSTPSVTPIIKTIKSNFR